MTPIIRVARLALLLAGLSAHPLQAAPQTAEAFRRLAESDIALSPDGRWIAWLDPAGHEARVILFDVQARKTQRVLAVPPMSTLKSMSWSDDDTLMISLNKTDSSEARRQVAPQFLRTLAIRAPNGEPHLLPARADTDGRGAAVEATLLATHSATPHTAIMETEELCDCLLAVDTQTGQGKPFKWGNEFTTGWAINPAGEAVARLDWDQRTYRLFVLREDREKPREILHRDAGEAPSLMGLLADGSAAVLLARMGLKHQAAWAVPLDGSPVKTLVSDPDADISRVFTDRHTGAVLGVYLEGAGGRVRWLDTPAQRRQDVLERSFPGLQVNVYGWTTDGSKALARVDTPSSRPVYYFVDFTRHRADIVTE